MSSVMVAVWLLNLLMVHSSSTKVLRVLDASPAFYFGYWRVVSRLLF